MRNIYTTFKAPRTRGFTLVEIAVVLAIVGLLCSLILPVLAKARKKARQVQCSSQLRQLSQAMMMYTTDHGRDSECYPSYITDLKKLGYVPGQAIFVCPEDLTHATLSSNGKSSLKPIYQTAAQSPTGIQVPSDDKSDWAERVSTNYAANCSYLYEFSARPCQQYDTNIQDWIPNSPSSFAYDMLAWWDDPNGIYGDVSLWPPDGIYVDKRGPDKTTGIGTASWQDVKFWQLANGDVYNTGNALPGDTDVNGNKIIPEDWSSDPWDQIAQGTADAQHGYPRTWMPIIRCFWHMTPQLVDSQTCEEVLNMSVDGNTFYSVPGWEQTAWTYGRQTQLPMDPDNAP